MVGERNSGTQQLAVKVRRPWVVAVLAIVTLGIYAVVWVYKVNRELRDYGAARGQERLARSRPWHSVLAVTVGGLLVVPALVAYVHTVGRLQDAERIAGGERRPAGMLIALFCGSTVLSVAPVIAGQAAALTLVTLVAWLGAIALTQDRLNRLWRESGATGARSLPAAVATVG